MESYARLLVRRAWLVLVAVVLVTAWLATGIGKLQADFDVEKSLPKNHPFTTIDKEIRSKFGGRNTIPGRQCDASVKHLCKVQHQ